MDDNLLIRMSNDFTRREGAEMAKRPKFDRGSSLWDQPNQMKKFRNKQQQ